jgi:hypothetical protein
MTADRGTRRMVWAFLGQLILIACLYVTGDFLAPGAIKIAVVIIILLPFLAFLTVIAQPAVYRAWGEALGELFEAAVASARAVRNWLRLATLIRLWHAILKLPAFPRTADGLFALVLFPCKVYVALAFPFLVLTSCALTVHEPRFAYGSSSDAKTFLLEGYALSLVVLLLGALLQSLFSRRGRSTQTVLMFLLGLAFMWLMLTSW